MIQLKNKLVAVLFLLLFSVYYISILAFTHIHYINGAMIVHSHPSSDSEHTHTDSECYFIAHLSSFETLKAAYHYITSVELSLLYTLTNTRDIFSNQGIHLENTGLRAPPAF